MEDRDQIRWKFTVFEERSDGVHDKSMSFILKEAPTIRANVVFGRTSSIYVRMGTENIERGILRGNTLPNSMMGRRIEPMS